MSLLRSADVFKAVELQVSQLFSGQLICPHPPGARCVAGEHLTLSEAREAASRHADDPTLREALWRCIGRYAHSDSPDMAHRGQLLALWFVTPYLRKSAAKASRRLYVDVKDVRSAMIYGALRELAVVSDGDVRERVVRAANDAAWDVERANPLERTADPQSLVDRRFRCDDAHEVGWDQPVVRMAGEVGLPLWEQISGERLGATLHGLGALETFLSAGPRGVSRGEPDPSKGGSA